ncbi:pitrilysin family protein [Flavobacterium sp. j3]|uniref:Pitrilysin family protein n=1 Tax=Flavobacterium aureirubrum TaxID=3133147 RepID=A0ABU9N4W2_9FLAO
MKKSLVILSSLFLTLTMQAQNTPQPKKENPETFKENGLEIKTENKHKIAQPKPGPAPTIKIGKPQSFKLANGLTVLVVENHKLPRVSFSLSIDNLPYVEGDKKGVADMTSAMIGSGTTKISKDAFNEEVDFLGASINFGSNGATANALSKYSKRVLELMADGALNPNFTQEEFDKQKEKMIESLKTEEKSVAAVAARVGDFLTFGKDHPSGEFLSEATLKNVTLEDVKKNYDTYFVPANAYLVIVGDVNAKETQKTVEKLFGNWKAEKAPEVSYSEPKDVAYTQINFVDMPNAVQSEVSVGNLTDLKMTDPDYFAAIVANQILGGDFNSYINMNLREAHGWTYGARSSVSGSKYTSKFEATTQVRNMVTDSTVTEIFKEFKRLRTEKVTDEMLANVKAGYVGRFVMQIEKPQTVATYALRKETQKLPADFYENYIKNINAVTADDIMRVANKYFLADNARIVIVGKATDVLPSLEKLKIPILYFDKFGNPTEKPAMKKPVPAGVTVKTVLDNYLKAIGGEKAIASVKTTMLVGSAKIPQAPAPISMTQKKDAKGKSSMIIAMAGMGELSKQVMTEKGGYSVAQGQRKEMTAEEFAEEKASSGLFDELTLLKKNGLTVDGIEPFNGSDAYIVKDGKTTLYYDVKSGLKVGESKTLEQGDQKMTVTTNYGDYREVKGIKFPYLISINQGFELNFIVSDVKINEGVSDADFQ